MNTDYIASRQFVLQIIFVKALKILITYWPFFSQGHAEGDRVSLSEEGNWLARLCSWPCREDQTLQWDVGGL